MSFMVCCLESMRRNLSGPDVIGATSERWEHRQEAAEWLDSQDHDIGSFRWVCDNLGFDYGDARDKILKHASAGHKTPRCHRARVTTADPYPAHIAL